LVRFAAQAHKGRGEGAVEMFMTTGGVDLLAERPLKIAIWMLFIATLAIVP
jgi:hypothetical protein